VVDKEKEEKWIEKYRDALIHATPNEPLLKRALRASARILAAIHRTPNKPASAQPVDSPNRASSENPFPETKPKPEQEKKAG
jgi:aminoglycoside phosphotransferase (APT) family kinase protein